MALVLDGSGDITGLVTGALESTAIGTGAVLQVVSARFSTQSSTTSTSYVDTGLTASITPISTNSKILVVVATTGHYISNSANYARCMLVRNSTQLGEFLGAAGYNSAGTGTGAGGMTYLDSPSTTSSTTYKVQINSATGGTVYWCNNGSQCSITLMEIA